MLGLSNRNAILAIALLIAYFLIFGNFHQVLRWVVIGAQTFNRKFPFLSDIILTIIGLYIVWRLFKIVFWFWMNLIITTLKITLTVSLVFMAFAIYLRGMERLFTKDIPFLLQLFRGDVLDLKEKSKFYFELIKSQIIERKNEGFNANILGKDFGQLNEKAGSNIMGQLGQLLDSVQSFIKDDGTTKDNVNKAFLSWRYK